MRYHDEQYLDDHMGTVFYHEKYVTTRKPHPCDGCGHVWPPGVRLFKFYGMTTEDVTPRGGYMCWHNSMQGYCKHEAQAAQEAYNAEHANDRIESEQ